MQSPIGVGLLMLALVRPFDAAAQGAWEWTVGGSAAEPAMRDGIYRSLQGAQACVDARDWACAQSLVTRARQRPDLSSYERAHALSFQAYLDVASGDIAGAIDAYEQLLDEPDAPAALEQPSRYAMASLYTQQGRYEAGLEALDAWWRTAVPGDAEPYMLKGRLNFHLGRYETALDAADDGLALVEARSLAPREPLYALKADSLLELGALDTAARTLETAFALWPGRDRYLQLAALYDTLDDDERLLALLETADASGWLQTGRECVTLASLLLESDRGPEAADVLARGIDQGLIENSVENRALLERTGKGDRRFF